jgi:hypothetical protein
MRMGLPTGDPVDNAMRGIMTWHGSRLQIPCILLRGKFIMDFLNRAYFRLYRSAVSISWR